MGIFSAVINMIKLPILLVLASLLFVNIFIYLFLTTLADSYIEPSSWINSLEKNNFSKNLQEVLITWMVKENIKNTSIPLSEEDTIQISKDDIVTAFKEAVPETLIKDKANKLIIDLFLYLRGQKNEFKGEIHVAELRDKLVTASTKAISPAIDKYIDNELAKPMIVETLQCKTGKECIEYCENNQDNYNCIYLLLHLNNEFGSNIQKLSIASIKETAKEIFSKKLSEKVSESDKFPQSIKLIEPGSETETKLKDMKQGVGLILLANNIVLITALFLAIIISLVTFSKKGILRWLGAPLFMAGLILLAISLFAQPIAQNLIEEKITLPVEKDSSEKNISSMTSNTILLMITGVAGSLIENMFLLLKIKSAIAAVLGLVMIAISFFVN